MLKDIKAHGAHEAHHEQLGFWREYVFSTRSQGDRHPVRHHRPAVPAVRLLADDDHAVAAGLPGRAALPLIGGLLGEARSRAASCCPSSTTSSGAMHGTIMVFLGVVPLAVGGFGNFVMPLQIGAPDMAFPKLNMVSYWVYFVGGVVMLASFFVPGGAAQSGWTSYPPLSVIAATGQTMWLVGMIFLITSSLLGSINFIVDDRAAAREGPDAACGCRSSCGRSSSRRSCCCSRSRRSRRPACCS